MKVVYIADIGIEGGATKSLVELVSTMKTEYGIEPVVLTSGENRLNQLLNEQHIENHAVGHGAFLQGAPDAFWKKPIKYIIYGVYYYTHFRSSLKRALQAVDWTTVDLIHTNVARDDIGMALSRRTGVHNICHIREFAELDFNCWSYRPNYVKYLANNTNEFIAISNAVKDYWVKKGLDKNTISVIYNGVDSSKIISVDRSQWKDITVLRMVIVGGVIPNKGQWQAIEALCLLPEEVRKNVRLDVIGNVTDTYKAKLQEPLKKHGIADYVSFLGGCDDVYLRLQNYHIGLMCSKAEGFGRVTVEYMHAGLAVIASNCGANSELIENGKTGILYERDDTNSLSRAIQELYVERALLCEVAANGQIYAKNNFTKEINARGIYNYYCRCK
ncbi:glycosyltransferase family 4 protein [Desulfosporosinus sp. BG]|uniref:glycosyltransferase family 4 protein n=1 Tax=Desulfosporosinus sp. BG TaxID=1633135 RepID=UPI00083A1E58|nr:glycosyltransferase family 4 protein [Desulfosporosinus sp. BG]ODA39138.1 Exopolysaccharide biosynthesis glycosyltransferase EpsF [Desulfosporosinus sp. BG]